MNPLSRSVGAKMRVVIDAFGFAANGIGQTAPTPIPQIIVVLTQQLRRTRKCKVVTILFDHANRDQSIQQQPSGAFLERKVRDQLLKRPLPLLQLPDQADFASRPHEVRNRIDLHVLVVLIQRTILGGHSELLVKVTPHHQTSDDNSTTLPAEQQNAPVSPRETVSIKRIRNDTPKNTIRLVSGMAAP